MPKKIKRRWTVPSISPKITTERSVGHHCFVWFRYFDLDKQQWSNPIRRKPTLEHPYTKRNHFLSLKALAKAIEYKLSVEGWNPLTDSYPTGPEIPLDDQLTKIQAFTFTEALQFSFSKKCIDWSKRTIQSYESVVKFLQQAARSLDIHKKKMADFELPHFVALLEKARQLRKLSPKGFNKYREYLSSLVGEMIQWQIVKINLVHHVKTKETEKTKAHRPPSIDERKLITEGLKKYPDYYRYLAVLYGCTFRPEEITRLQIKHYKVSDCTFHVPAANTKNRTERIVIIPDWVKLILDQLDLSSYSCEHFIFSTRNKYTTFLPGPNKMHVNTTNHWWRKIIKNKTTGLGLDLNQYSLKKLAGDDMVRIQKIHGNDRLLELPQSQMGHSTPGMTSIYVEEHIQVMNELVRRKMPVL